MASARPPTGEFDVDVSDEQVAFFHENGYLSIDRITTDEEVAWIGEVFDELFADTEGGLLVGYLDATRGYGAEGTAPLGQVLFPDQRVPGLRHTIFRQNAKKVISHLLDLPESELHGWGHMINKPARFGDETPWHQDEAYWEPELTYHAVGAWMALDDADVDNGCLWYLPGSHRGDVLPHRHLHDDPMVHALVVDVDVDTSPAVPIPTPAGGAAFHHPRTLHHSRPNTTDRQRRSFSIEFQTTPVKRDHPVERQWIDDQRAAMAEHVAAQRATTGAS